MRGVLRGLEHIAKEAAQQEAAKPEAERAGAQPCCDEYAQGAFEVLCDCTSLERHGKKQHEGGRGNPSEIVPTLALGNSSASVAVRVVCSLPPSLFVLCKVA